MKKHSAILILGAPGAGKGTQGKILGTIPRFIHFSCGDAFRSGLLYGIANGWDWQTSGQLASVMGGIKIEQPGTQNHAPSKSDIEARYRENYGSEISLA